MKKHLKNSEIKSPNNSQTLKTKTVSGNIQLISFEKMKHLPDFYELYPDYSKNSAIEGIPFTLYYPELIRSAEAKSTYVYTITRKPVNEIIGFLVFEKVYPFIVDAHIVVKPEYRNFYNAYRASQQAISDLFDKGIKQVMACIPADNKNALVLLNKLGFNFWGKENDCMVYSLTATSRKG